VVVTKVSHQTAGDRVSQRVALARARIENLRPRELLAELLDPSAPPVAVIDVRGHDEYRSGHIVGSINVPRGTIELAIGGIVRVDVRVVVCSDNGARSALAAEALYRIGYRDVAHLDGGLRAWRAANLPLGGSAASAASRSPGRTGWK
jgi:rhodanese-related sulfurtransferase